jgi:hypothetical protein
MTTMAALQAQGPASFPQERATPPPPYSTASASPRSLSVAPRRITKGAFRPLSCPTLAGAGPAALPAVHRYHEGPDFSLRVDPAFRTLPYSSVYPSGSSAPPRRHEHRLRGRNEISPGQTPLCPSVLPAHTMSRSALRRYFLRRKAASSDQRAHGRPVRHGFRLGCGPEVRRKPFGFHLAMDTLPSSWLTPRGRRDLPGLLSTHPPCEGAAGLSPARETPCWAHNPNRRIDRTENCGKHESERLPMRSQGRACQCTPSHTGGPSDAFERSEPAAGGQG